MKRWIDEALDADVRFFVTALGNPRWVCEAVHSAGGVVYHDVTEKKWAEKAIAEGVDGLICVNRRAGGHAGAMQPRELFQDMQELGVPLVCAGGIGSEEEYVDALKIGYAACQLGTRFIATDECAVHETYRTAIIDAEEEDIVLTHRLSGVPCSVIRTPMIDRLGTEAGPVARWLLKNRKTRHWMRTLYTLKSIRGLKRSSREGLGNKDVYQAGKSVAGIKEVLPAGEIVRRFSDALSSSSS